MRFQFSFKKMETSLALQKYAEEKILSQIHKFVTKPIEAHVTFSVERHRHTAHCELVGGDGFNASAEHVCEDMYGSVDQMIDKLARQLKRQKDKIKAHTGHKSRFDGEGKADLESVEIDADDIVKFEEAKRRAAAN